jgi:hypothetical protein
MKHVRFRMGVLAVVMAIALFVTPGEAADKIQYRLRLQKGQKYYLKTITEQKISQTIMGQQQNIEQTFGIAMDFDVVDVNDRGVVEICYVYRWSKFRQKGPMGEMVYDSAQKDPNVQPMAQGFAALIGETFSLKMTPEGRVEKVEGTDKIRENIQKKLPSGIMRQQAMMSLQQYIDAGAIKQIAESSAAMYPDRPVGVGDSWSKKVSIEQGFAMIVENTITVKERKNNVARMEITSVIEPNPKAKPMDMGAMKVSYQLSGTQKGTMSLDERTGLFVRSKMEQQMSGQVTMSAAGAESGGMAIPMKIEGVTTVEMTERKK